MTVLFKYNKKINKFYFLFDLVAHEVNHFALFFISSFFFRSYKLMWNILKRLCRQVREFEKV